MNVANASDTRQNRWRKLTPLKVVGGGFVLLSLVSALLIAALLFSGARLAEAAHRNIGSAPLGLDAENVLVPYDRDQSVAGWLLRGEKGRGVMLLLHGVRADRRDMLLRAQWLHAQGYTVLLVDLPAHGESSGAAITYGAHEAEGVRAAWRYLYDAFPGERIGVIGVSLGAAAFVLAHPQPAPSAVILESMFPTLDEAAANRLELYFGSWARSLAPALTWQLKWRFDISPLALRPIEHMASLNAPLLLMAGELDRHTLLAESNRLYETAKAPKQIQIMAGAAHVDLHRYAPRQYETWVLPFLEQHMRPPTITAAN